jgi:hypothetical protein
VSIAFMRIELIVLLYILYDILACNSVVSFNEIEVKLALKSPPKWI